MGYYYNLECKKIINIYMEIASIINSDDYSRDKSYKRIEKLLSKVKYDDEFTDKIYGKIVWKYPIKEISHDLEERAKAWQRALRRF